MSGAGGAVVGEHATPPVPALFTYYGRTLADIEPGRYSPRLKLLRAEHAPLDVTALCSDLSWSEESIMSPGSATTTIQQPAPGAVWIARGHELELTFDGAGVKDWQAFKMRCAVPHDEDGLVYTVEAGDELEAMRRAVLHWHFPRDKTHPHGWSADEIARAVCKRLGVKIGSIVKGKARLHTSMQATGLKMISWAYEREHEAIGSQVFFRMIDGAFNVLQFQRNKLIYAFASEIQSAMAEEAAKENYFPVTVIEGYGYRGNGAGRQSLHHVEYNPQITRRIGYRPAIVRFGRCEGGMPELIAKCKRRLAQDLRVIRQATIVLPGVPFLRMGEGVMLDLPRQGFSGAAAFVYITSVKHTISGGEYSTELQLTALSPYGTKAERELFYQRTSQLSEAQGVPQIGPGEE